MGLRVYWLSVKQLLFLTFYSNITNFILSTILNKSLGVKLKFDISIELSTKE